jgi:SIR2-like domain
LAGRSPNMLRRVSSSPVPELSLDELARLHVVRGARLMWLIGAGASAAAGVPTAGQMIDEFRQLIYSTVHGVPLAALSLAEPAIRDRIERFFADHPDYPNPGDPGEYSALFEAAWGAPADRRAYLEGKLVVGKPAFGNFGLAVLAALGRAPVVWTPNFDRVYERAAELVLEPPAHLTVATLDTSKIAAAALAADRFPLYVKLHGDYQSDELKNTAEELREQDAVHRTALVQAAQRYGLIVAGYSGRDASLMAALTEGADGATPFPAGLFWCRRPGEDPLPVVGGLLEAARARGVDARWVTVPTFDELIGQLLLTCDILPRMQHLLDQARPPKRREPFTIPARHGAWPVVRLNCLPLVQFPLTCRQVDCGIDGTAAVRAALQATGARAVAVRRSTGVIAFGYDEDLRTALSPFGITSWTAGTITASRLCRDGSGDLGLLYDALTGALARERPVAARRSGRGHYLIAEPGSADDPTFAPLEQALARLAGRRRDVPGGGALAGRIGTDGPAWAEAVRLRLEYHYDTLWLVFEPAVWIEKANPDADLRATFTGPRTWHRYNPVADQLLDAWTQVLHGPGGRCALYGIAGDQGIDAVFELGDRTGFTRRQGK